MSTTVDNRIIIMKFDNAQFEKGVATTMNTLDKLKASLNFKSIATGLENITSTFKSIGNEASNVSFEAMASSLSALESRFSSFGIVGMRVIENLTDTMMGFANSVISFATNKIISGGITRAMNLENAQFQLEGLLNDEEKVAAVMQNVNDAVDGTAYSLDAAANVASQLAASGMEAGDNMFTALRAVAGVAAMTNSSYEDIGRVFTTVAGQGKVMTEQLNQLASRGMNAAATLANYLGTTEAEVRTMVSNGEVSFETFAAAMDDAFGEHAKAANETFTGSISNIGAALARIGAKFVSPLVAKGGDMVEMFNAIRVKINEVNASMDPIANTFTTTVNIIARLVKHYAEVISFADSLEILTNVVQGLDRRLKFIRVAFYNVFDPFESAKEEATGVTAALLTLSKAFNKISKATKATYIEETEKIFTALQIVLTDLSNVLGTVLQGFGHASRKLQQMNAVSITLGDVLLAVANAFHSLVSAIDNGKMDQTNTTYKLATDVFIVLTRVLETLKTVFSQVVNVAKLVGEAFAEVFDIKDGAETIRYAARMVRNFAQSLTLSDEDSKNLKDTFKGLFSIIKIVVDIFKSLVGAVWPATDGVSGLNSGILKITGAIGRFITGIADADTRTETITKTFGSFLDVIKSIPGYLSKMVSKFVEFVKSASGTDLGSKFSGVTDFFKNLFSNITNLNFSGPFNKILTAVSGFVSSIFDKLSSLGSKKSDGPDKMVSNVEKSVSPLSTIWNFLETIFAGMGTVFTSITSAFTSFFNAISPIFPSISNLFTSLAGALSSAFDLLKTLFDGLIPILSDFLSGISPVASSISGALQSIFNTIADHPVLSTFFASQQGFFIAFMSILKELATGITDITSIFKGFGDMESGLGKIGSGTNSFLTQLGTAAKNWKKEKVGSVVESMAKSILIIAVALYIVAQIPAEQIWTVTKALGAAFGEVAGVIIGFQKMQEKSDTFDLSRVTTSFIKMSVAILLLAIALKEVGEVNPDTLAASTVALVAVIGALGAAFYALAEQVGKNSFFSKPEMFNNIAIAMLAMGVAINMIAKAMKTLGEMTDDQVFLGFEGVALIFAMLATFIKLMVQFEPDPEMLKMIAVAMASLAVAISKIAKVAIKLGGEDFKSVQEGMLGLLEIAIIMSAIIVAIAKITAKGFEPKNFEVAAICMIAIAAAMNTIIPIILTLAVMDFSTMEGAILGFLEVMAIMVVALLAITKISGEVDTAELLVSVGAMYIMALALDTLIPLLALFAAMKVKTLIKVGVALAALFAIFAAAGYVAGSILELGVALDTLGAAVLLFGLGVFTMSLAFSNMTASMIALAVAWPLVSKVFLDMVSKIGEALPILASGFVDGLEALANSIIEALPTFVELGHQLLISFLDSLIGAIPEMVEFILQLIIQILDAIVENGEQIANDIIEMLKILVDFLVAASYELGVLIVGVIINFLNGIFDEIGDRAEEFFDSLIGMFIKIIDGLASAIEGNGDDFIAAVEHLISAIFGVIKKGWLNLKEKVKMLGKKLPNWLTAGIKKGVGKIWTTIKKGVQDAIDGISGMWDKLVEIGKNIIDGIVKGIEDFIDDPVGAIGDAAQGLLDGFCSLLGIASPSKVMRKLGGYVCQGLAIGIDKGTDGVVDSSKDLASATYDAISTPMSSLADLLGSDFDVDPTIRPVLDLTSVQEGAQQIGGLLNQQTLDLATTNSRLSESRESAKTSKTSDLNSNMKALTDAIQNGNFGIPDDAKIIVYSVLDGKTVGTTVAPFVDSINGTTYTKAKRGYVT